MDESDFKLWMMQLGVRKPDLDGIAQNMRAKLDAFEATGDGAAWEAYAWRSLLLLWDRISQYHQATLPEMACQRSGRCCEKQVPRVSMFEALQVAKTVAALPVNQREAVLDRCKRSVSATYKDPKLGVGVACPLLAREPNGKSVCTVHANRPMICRMSAVSTEMSWNCPIWTVYQNRNFPTLPDAWVDPLLKLFAHLRTRYAEFIMKDKTHAQMVLLGVGVLAVLNRPLPPAPQPQVTMLWPSVPECADELWKRKLGPPPPQLLR